MNTWLRMSVAVACITVCTAQTRDAAGVLSDMRRALGGDAVLDAVRSFTVSGSTNEKMWRGTKGFAIEYLALLPDHFMVVKRDSQSDQMLPIDITYWHGFRGDVLIRKTESSLPMPPDPGPHTPDAIEERRRCGVLGNKQELARMALVLLGKSIDAYPMQFTMVGAETVNGKAMEVVEARAADGFATRLYVDAATHLPAIIAWQAPEPVTFVTSSSMTLNSSGRVVSPPSTPAVPALASPCSRPATITKRLELSDFKAQDGVLWPRRWRVMSGKDVDDDIRLGGYKINPKISPKTFDVGG